MLVDNQIINVRIKKDNLEWYFKKGYECNSGDILSVNVRDLALGSNKYVLVKCDYCGNIFEQQYNNFNRGHKNIDKDACYNCRKIKIEESNLNKYGVKSTNQLQDVKLKKEKTCLENYGSKYYLQSEIGKENFKKVCQQKYGVDNINQVESIKKKKEQHFLEKYGVKCNLHYPEIQEKIRENTKKKYGFEYAIQNEKIKNKREKTFMKRYGCKNPLQNNYIKAKVRQTLFNNKSAQCSKQQYYLYKLLGGYLNYPVGACSLDIAFPNEKIYIEYNGGFHDGSVKLGYISMEEFLNKERKRDLFLKNLGWKKICIKSISDNLPQDDQVEYLITKAKKYLTDTEHTYYEINIDENKVKCKEYEIDYEFIIDKSKHWFRKYNKE